MDRFEIYFEDRMDRDLMWEFGAQSKRQMPMSITDHDKGEEQFGEKKILV